MQPEFIPAADALPLAVKLSGKSMYAISVAMNRVPSYLATTIGRGSTPTIATAAEIASHCGYYLALIPCQDELPIGSLVITPEESE